MNQEFVLRQTIFHAFLIDFQHTKLGCFSHKPISGIIVYWQTGWYRNSQPQQQSFLSAKNCAVLLRVLNGIPVLTLLTEAAIFPYVSDSKILLSYIVISLNVWYVSFPFGLINFQLNLFSVPLCIQTELYPLLLLITLHSHNRYQYLMQLTEFKYFTPLLIEQ